MTLLVVEGLSKRFGGLVAVDDVSVTVERGEILGVIGPNGAGKTTLFNMVSGFIRPDRGSVTLDGRPITGWRPHRIARAGLLRTFQLVKPFGSMTLCENLQVPLLRAGQPRRQARERAAALLERFRLARFAEELPGEVPYAIRRRLEIARAVAGEPRLLLLDEALAGLTPGELEEMLEVLRDVRAGGVTLVMIEHVMDATMRLCDRVLVLDRGRRIALGSPAAVTRDPGVIEAYLGQEAET